MIGDNAAVKITSNYYKLLYYELTYFARNYYIMELLIWGWAFIQGGQGLLFDGGRLLIDEIRYLDQFINNYWMRLSIS